MTTATIHVFGPEYTYDYESGRVRLKADIEAEAALPRWRIEERWTALDVWPTAGVLVSYVRASSAEEALRHGELVRSWHHTQSAVSVSVSTRDDVSYAVAAKARKGRTP